MSLLLEKPINYKSTEEYISELRDFKTAKDLKLGYFYSYFYDYKTEYAENILKYFDGFPLVLIFNRAKNGNLYGFNFHHAPLNIRAYLLSRMKLGQPNKFKNDSPNKMNISYLTLTSMLKKAPLCVRQYIPSSAHNIKIIPNSKMSELAKYALEEYHSSTFPQVVRKYTTTKI